MRFPVYTGAHREHGGPLKIVRHLRYLKLFVAHLLY